MKDEDMALLVIGGVGLLWFANKTIEEGKDLVTDTVNSLKHTINEANPFTPSEEPIISSDTYKAMQNTIDYQERMFKVLQTQRDIGIPIPTSMFQQIQNNLSRLREESAVFERGYRGY